MSKVFDADSLISKMPSTFHSTKKELLVVSEENLDSYGHFPFFSHCSLILEQFTTLNKNCSMSKFP